MEENQNLDVNVLNITDRGIHENDRVIKDYDKLLEVISFFKKQGKRIVYTSGVYDLYHVGHAKYLEKAKECGDILILAIDTDQFVRNRKGPKRPIVDLEERLAILVRNRSVDILTILHSYEGADELIKKIHPDVLVISQTTNDKPNFVEDMNQKLSGLVGRIEVLPPQAETSTTARVRFLALDGASELSEKIMSSMNKVIEEHFTLNGHPELHIKNGGGDGK